MGYYSASHGRDKGRNKRLFLPAAARQKRDSQHEKRKKTKHSPGDISLRAGPEREKDAENPQHPGAHQSSRFSSFSWISIQLASSS